MRTPPAQIVHKSNDRLMVDMETCAQFKVPLVISSLGAREEINDAVHSFHTQKDAASCLLLLLRFLKTRFRWHAAGAGS